MIAIEKIEALCEMFHLPATARDHAIFADDAAKRDWSYREFLEKILRHDMQ